MSLLSAPYGQTTRVTFGLFWFLRVRQVAVIRKMGNFLVGARNWKLFGLDFSTCDRHRTSNKRSIKANNMYDNFRGL